MEANLPKLLDRIPQVVAAELFRLPDPNQALDDRDSQAFESEWLRVHDELAALDSQCSPTARLAIRAVEEAAFKAAYLVTGSGEFSELAPAVSDDFGLFARAVCHGFHDGWLAGLAHSYRRGVFPSGRIAHSQASILGALA